MDDPLRKSSSVPGSLSMKTLRLVQMNDAIGDRGLGRVEGTYRIKLVLLTINFYFRSPNLIWMRASHTWKWVAKITRRF